MRAAAALLLTPRCSPHHNPRLQPVRDTRERQLALWKEFILEYTRVHRVRASSASVHAPVRVVHGCTRFKTRQLLVPGVLRQIFVVHVDEDTPLFCNSAINRALRQASDTLAC
jgi:hypothetical protein